MGRALEVPFGAGEGLVVGRAAVKVSRDGGGDVTVLYCVWKWRR